MKSIVGLGNLENDNYENYFIERLKYKDKKALGFLYDRYSGAIYGYLLKCLKNETRAGEILNKIFLNLFMEISKYNPENERFFTWLLHLAQGQARVLVPTLAFKKENNTSTQHFLNPLPSNDLSLSANWIKK